MIEPRGGKDAYLVVFTAMYKTGVMLRDWSVYNSHLFTTADSEDELYGFCERVRKKAFPVEKWQFSCFYYTKISGITSIERNRIESVKVFDPKDI